ncbi:proline iminopeptidase Pip [Mycobacteroides abscessus]|uniref:Alpha/beta hydrolase n=2 Tax=Mycobacterium avium TaxID=1764 RepID=A0A2A2ZNJ4_MYCAV|nr:MULTISPECIES: alpha/beta fold hydrolase [Mycobacteriaceae]MDO2384355.1 alpha/beta fold hydrolase [Mycobacterium avium subsp. hominissuis]MDO2395903.1 alpha/beta fold hydrolase [Mycobacterium avium subsp. hominissuis]PBA27930.1 alpha/beta hydrolase [Mycobacterium avium]CPT65132.1 proline iminopeptidase Pip [Mycobacteroides abscessus]CPU62659.1 proline iminopeptidase Pip [Mycobacteroides abscessus]
MTLPALTAVDFGGPEDAPLLVLGPSLGTSVAALWSNAARLLATRHRVIGFDLPGHGGSPPPVEAFTMADLAHAVDTIAMSYEAGPYHYAGVSAGGAVGLELLLDHEDRIATAALICTGAKIRTAEAWSERARNVRRNGTSAMTESARITWFSAGFPLRDPDTAAALLESLRETNAEGYAATCDALGQFDVRDRLTTIGGDVIAIAGAEDIATPPSSLLYLAEHIPRCDYLEIAQTAHLAPAEQPELIAQELLALTQRSPA